MRDRNDLDLFVMFVALFVAVVLSQSGGWWAGFSAACATFAVVRCCLNRLGRS